MALLLGVDVGTTGTKTILVDETGGIKASAYQGYTTYREKEEHAEQDANDWWYAVVRTIKECTRNVGDKNEIKAISLSTQGGSMVPVDSAGSPLMRAIIWMDRRGTEQGRRLAESRESGYFYDRTGWGVGSSLNLVQIMWLKESKPDLFAKTCKFVSTVEFVNGKLTGEFCGDPVNAGITLLLNIREKKWDADILGLLGISENRLARIVESGDMIGTLSERAAKELDLPAGVRVVSGGHDQYCVALGAGAINSGDVMLSTGTAWVVLGISDQPIFDTVSGFSPGNHVVKGKWGTLSSLPTGGASLEWFRDNIGSLVADPGGNMQKESFVRIDEMAGKKPAGSGGVMFFPHFTGSPCPNGNPASKASMLGLDLSHDRYNIARAVMEGIAFDVNWMLEDLRRKGMDSKTLKVLGGATRSDLWMRIIADVTGLTVLKPETPDAACLGAAILAGAGAGLFRDLREGCSQLVRSGAEISPDPENSHIYKGLFDKYKIRYRCLKEYYDIF